MGALWRLLTQHMKQEEWPLDNSSLEHADRVAYLIFGHIRKTLTALERRELDAWLEASEKNVELFEELTDEANIQKAMGWYARTQPDKALQRAKQKIHFIPAKNRNRRLFLSIAVAASIILVVTAAAYFLALPQKQNKPAPAVAANTQPMDKTPGGNKAVLVLADGRRLVLDSLPSGALAAQGLAQVMKTDSALSYYSESGTPEKEMAFNTLETPTGGQYKLTLSDGTVVWLNAASSLRYPTAFTSKERVVELRGEGYFEVRHNASQPFKVKTGDVVLEDLGTSFNVNSYNDEGLIKATLIEGAVKVIRGGQFKLLRPGEEAQVGTGSIEVVKADVDAAIGWTRGEFVFRGTPITTVMKSLERWYGIEIFNKESNSKHLVATIKRDVPLSKVLYYLEKTGDVHFQWRGKNLILLP
jgi:transmembrane sensor